MADSFDKAQDLEQAEREAAIARHSSRPAAPKPVGRGYCLNCFEEFEGVSERLYCDGKCASEHAVKTSRKY